MIRKAGSDRIRVVLPLVLLLLLPFAVPRTEAAQPFFGGQSQRPERQNLVQPGSQEGVSREQAAGMVQRRTGGRVLSTTPVQRGGDVVGYDVRVLIDGKRVKNVFVDQRGNVRGRD